MSCRTQTLKSVRKPKARATGSWMSWMGSYWRRRSRICSKIRVEFSRTEAIPTLKGVNWLSTKGRLETGEVPSSALMEQAMPKDMMSSPTQSIP